MNTQRSARATALALSIVLTLGLLVSIERLSSSPASEQQFNSVAGTADQTIVIEAKRDAS